MELSGSFHTAKDCPNSQNTQEQAVMIQDDQEIVESAEHQDVVEEEVVDVEEEEKQFEEPIVLPSSKAVSP